MSEEKKPVFRHASVVGGTFDELVERLQEARNKLHEEGYTTHIEPIHEHVKPRFGYVIHGEIKSESRVPMMMPLSLSQLQDMLGQGQEGQEGHRGQLKEKTQTFVGLAFSKVKGQKYSEAVVELPAIVSSLMGPYTMSDLTEIAEDLEKEVNECGTVHLEKCFELQTFNVIATTIQGNKRLNVS